MLMNQKFCCCTSFVLSVTLSLCLMLCPIWFHRLGFPRFAEMVRHRWDSFWFAGLVGICLFVWSIGVCVCVSIFSSMEKKKPANSFYFPSSSKMMLTIVLAVSMVVPAILFLSLFFLFCFVLKKQTNTHTHTQFRDQNGAPYRH